MKKKLIITVVALLMLAVLTLTLVACNSEMNYVEKLLDKGYKYVAISGHKEREDGLTTFITTSYDGGYISEMQYEGVQRGGFIYVYATSEQAKTCYENKSYLWGTDGSPYWSARVKDNVLFFGTEQFLNDIGA